MHPAWPLKSIYVAPVSYAQQDCPSSLVAALHFHRTLQCRQRRNYSQLWDSEWEISVLVYAVRPPLGMLYISQRGGREVHFTVSWQSSQAFIFAFYLVKFCKNIVTECEILKEKCGVPHAIQKGKSPHGVKRVCGKTEHTWSIHFVIWCLDHKWIGSNFHCSTVAKCPWECSHWLLLCEVQKEKKYIEHMDI